MLDSVEEALSWLSYRSEPVAEDIKVDLGYQVEKILPAIEALSPLVEMADRLFASKGKEDRKKIKSLIRDFRQHEHEADLLEQELIYKIFKKSKDPLQVVHLVRLAETIGAIADHSQNASDMMRAMIAE